ncbi:class F sortase [Streptomyces pathocidini]|uniref:Class F sortase n=1 Tax=Streptomyces pathocidini TaxID=1650571 RepID=A0ABW7UJH2_9ACTN|nr:class F sortase [Streptomyces pathocidini]
MASTGGRDGGGYTPPRVKRSPWGLVALVLLIGVALIRNGAADGSGPPQPASDSAADSRYAVTLTPDEVLRPSEPLPKSSPSRIVVPTIRVNAPLTRVGLDSEGWIDSPPADDKNLAGWFKDAVTPGEKGTAVVVGHVDNQKGPAVFYNLGALKKGNEVEVARKDGRTAVFSVYGIEVFDKKSFPADRVYGETGSPELRVITCGGGYSKGSGYSANVVVFARLVQTRG